MKKVMILGAGRGQIPIMEICRKYGWYIITVSPKGDYPGLQVADKVYFLNVIDKDAVLRAAITENIQAILTDQLDVAVQTVAYVAEKMGLPGITLDVALKFTNKCIMREEARNIGINVPQSITVACLEDLLSIMNHGNSFEFPLMMKPVDSDASRGVYKVNNINDIIAKFADSKAASGAGAVILEQYVEGKEYVVDAFTRDFEVTNLVVGHRDYFRVPDTFIPNATVFVDALSADSALEMRLKAINKQLVEGFGLKFGITHGEYIYNEKEDKIYLVEIAARGGGVFISSDLIPAASGVDANDLLVREALGIEERNEINLQTGASAYFCYLTPKGIVSRLKGIDDVHKMTNVIKAYFDNIYPGMVTDDIVNKSSRKGPILVKGRTKADCYATIECVKSVLDIEVTEQNQTYSVIWH